VLIVLGSATAAPGRRDELIAAALEVSAATRGDEGCLSYSFAADLEDPETISSVEVWHDQAALDAHMEHEHTQQFLARVGGLFAGGPQMSFHHVNDPDGKQENDA
jgi:quinol monooxygenase YgiN